MGSSVASFRVRGVHNYETYRLGEGKSWHFPSEVGPALRLPTTDLQVEQESSFRAVLKATTAGGVRLKRELEVPVHILPVGKQE